MLIHAKSAKDSRRGIAVTECAVMLPVLLIVVLGVLEIGTALRASTILQSACRESGRLVCMDWRYVVSNGQTPNAKVEQDLRNFITASGLDGAAATVSLTYAEGGNLGQPFDLSDENNDLEFVKIEITLPYESVSVFPLRYLEGSSLVASVVMRATMSGGSLSN